MISKKKIGFIVFGGILLLITAGILYIFTPRKLPDNVIDYLKIEPYLQDGDIILRQGDATWSAVFSDFSLTDKRFSHVGIVRIRDGDISIIHAIGNILNKARGVEVISLERFMQQAMSVGIFRARYVDAALISDKVMNYVGLPFDWDFDISDDSKIYCTELLYVVLRDIAPQYNITTRFVDTLNREIIPLDSISNSHLFEEILFIELEIK